MAFSGIKNLLHIISEEAYAFFVHGNLSEYKEWVNHAASSNSNEVIGNASGIHATMVLDATLKNSRSFFYIYDCNITGDLLRRKRKISLFDDFKEFLAEDPKREIRIIVDSEGKVDSEVRKKLESLGDRLSMFRLNKEELTSQNVDMDNVSYFSVSDRGVRMQPKVSRGLFKRKAVALFGDQERIDSLKNAFVQLESKSTPL